MNDAAENPTDEMRIENIAAILDYLKAAGWKVTRTSLYRHRSEGKILPEKCGQFSQKDVDKYAKNWLKQQSTGKRVSTKTDELQREKLELELKNLQLDSERKKFQHEKEQGKYIPKEQMEIELAARAGILDAGLKHWIQSRAADWIRTVNGDTKKVGDMINMMNKDMDEHINSYASTKEYMVIIDAEEEGIIEVE